MVEKFTHDPSCSGCPACRAEFCELLRMDSTAASRYLRRRTEEALSRVRGARKFVNVVLNAKESAMPRHTLKSGRSVYVPPLPAAAPPRRAPEARPDPWGLRPVATVRAATVLEVVAPAPGRSFAPPDPYALDEVRR